MSAHSGNIEMDFDEREYCIDYTIYPHQRCTHHQPEENAYIDINSVTNASGIECDDVQESMEASQYFMDTLFDAVIDNLACE